MNARILVWDLPTRVFHWSLALSFATAYLTAEIEALHLVHVTAGLLFAALIVFRLIWGVVGSRYARFAEFVRGPGAALAYLRSLFSGRPAHHVGHNPAGAIAIVLLLALGLGTAGAGWLLQNDIGGELFEEVHEVLANTLLALVIVHILGVIVSSLLHRENLARAMLTGVKRGATEQGIHRPHGMIALLLVVAVAGFGWALVEGKLPQLLDPAAVSESHHHEHEHDD